MKVLPFSFSQEINLPFNALIISILVIFFSPKIFERKDSGAIPSISLSDKRPYARIR